MRSLKVLSAENPREIAADVLNRRGPNDYVEDLLERTLAAKPMPGNDRGLCQELVFGVTRQQAALDWLIARKTGGREQKPGLRTLLRLGLYQVFWMDRIPGHAAANETVEIAKHRGFGAQAGFINAILRNYLRELEPTRAALKDLRQSEPWTGYSHPEWLVRKWLSRFGQDQTIRLLEWNNTAPPTFARVNTLKIDAERLLPQWREEKVEYDFVRKPWLEENLIFQLKEHPPLQKLPSFNQGLFYVQDPSTLLAVHQLEVAPGQSIMDLCAAPGGKLTYIAQRLKGQGKLTGRDLSTQRLELVRQNLQRLGIESVELQLAAAPGPAAAEYDRVLLDAPCSNTGVVRRRVELRWRITPQEVERLQAAQAGLLRTAAGLVKPGGCLVYSTCSIEPEENAEVVRRFLEENRNFQLNAEQDLLPFRDGVDGAYVAKILRAS